MYFRLKTIFLIAIFLITVHGIKATSFELVCPNKEANIEEEHIYRNMEKLCKIWGSIKYFHPAVAKGDTRKSGYINFSGKKYGKQSYLLTIPSNEIVKGEYGIFFMNIITATAIPVGTFSVK